MTAHSDGVMTQVAPYPTILLDLVTRYRGFPNRSMELVEQKKEDWGSDGTSGLRLHITQTTPDSYHTDKKRSVVHVFIVPAATYNEQSWRRWLLDRCFDVSRHEECEGFGLEGADGVIEKPYAPNHGPGNDPYFVFEVGTDIGRRTRNDGVLNP